MAARTPKIDPATMCRGRWSVCSGKLPSISAKWHLCKDCTAKRATAMKAQKAEVATITPKPAPKPAAKRVAKPKANDAKAEAAS